jgi:tetratricopeptide (TPR) repeat protein
VPLSFVGVLASACLAFANIGLGTPVPGPTLPGLDGQPRQVVAAGQVCAIVFFDPDQDRSRHTLSTVQGLRDELAGRGVRWTGIVSGSVGAEAVAAELRDVGSDLPTVVDPADGYYGQLGVRLFPTVAVVGADGNLAAYLPFSQVHYAETIRAHLLHALGELTDEQLQSALRPGEVAWGGDAAAAQRQLRLARMLRAAGKPDKALEAAREAVRQAPDWAEAHALVGVVLVEEGDCEGARVSLERALALDPGHAEAREALDAC